MVGSTPSTGDGAEVIDVTEDSPAADAGIEAGDVIVSLGDATITSSTDLSTEMDRYHAGDKVEVGWTDASGNIQHADPEADRRPARLTIRLAESEPASAAGAIHRLLTPVGVSRAAQALPNTSSWCSPMWGGRREMRHGDFGARKGAPG